MYRKINDLTKKLPLLFCLICFAMIIGSTTAYASGGTTATTSELWSKAGSVMNDVYVGVLSISTIAAVVTASIALLLMNFSKNGKTVDESRSWLKRIVICWCILNGLGFIMSYLTQLFADGKWTYTVGMAFL